MIMEDGIMNKTLILVGLFLIAVLLIVSCQKQQQTTGNVVLFIDEKNEKTQSSPIIANDKPLKTIVQHYEESSNPRIVTLLKEAFESGQELSCSFVISNDNAEGIINVKGNKFSLDILKRRVSTRIVFDGTTYFVYERDEDKGWRFKESEIGLFKKYHNDFDFYTKEDLINKATGARCQPDNFPDSMFKKPEKKDLEFGDVVTELVRDGINIYG